MSDLPRPARQYLLSLRAKTEAGELRPDEAGKRLAWYIRDEWPAIYEATVIRWCTARFRKFIPLPASWVQQDLWPASLWGEPLSKSVQYHETSCGMTRRWHNRDLARANELRELTEAARGDMEMTLEDAFRLAHPDEAASAG
jgi:hypothetical protein